MFKCALCPFRNFYHDSYDSVCKLTHKDLNIEILEDAEGDSYENDNYTHENCPLKSGMTIDEIYRDYHTY